LSTPKGKQKVSSEGRTGRILRNIWKHRGELAKEQVAGILAMSLLFASIAPHAFNDETLMGAKAYGAADTLKPLVTIEKPASGAKLPAGTIMVSGKAFDNKGGSGIQSVEVRLDGGPYKTAKPRTTGDWSTWSISFSVSKGGSHEFKAKTVDRSGNIDWDTVTVSVTAASKVGSPDTTDPKIAITYPVDGSTIAATSSITVKGTASDSGGSGMSSVQVRVDSGSYKTATPKAPGDWSTWSVTVAVTPGEHRLLPRATDKAGNQNWNSIHIMIADSTAPPPPDPDPDDDIPAPLRKISVNSIVSLNTAIGQARAGDHIILEDGVYGTSASIRVSSDGTVLNPIVIRAESDGGVEIGGSYGFSVTGASHVVIRGFKFTYNQDSHEAGCDDCTNVRFTSNTFALRTTSNDKSHWLGVTGTSINVRVDHNTFQNKPTEGVFLIIVGDNGRMPQNTHVDHNQFRDQTYGGSNGGECVRIGHSSLGPVAANSLFEYNTFERCNGDPEVVSVKSSKNIFKHNTFKNNDGSLVFRHGSGHVADGNMFIDGANGIRVYGANHKIVNNYFANNPTSGSSIRDPLIIPRGTVLNDATVSNAGYSQARNILVVHNTFVGNRMNIVIGAFSGNYLPEDITVANNIITGSSGNLVTVSSGDVSLENNILYPTGSASVGNVPTSGYSKLNPQLVSLDGMFRPSATSPAINAVQTTETYGITTDIDGQIRTGMFDIGADEYRTTS
jgi:poly(beta-D-mannuronate) lyase